jgi:hypothetical protein
MSGQRLMSPVLDAMRYDESISDDRELKVCGLIFCRLTFSWPIRSANLRLVLNIDIILY